MLRDIYWLSVRMQKLPEEIRNMTVEDRDYLVAELMLQAKEAASQNDA